MLVQLIMLAAGLALLILSAAAVVSGASALARRFGISELIVGLTVVAFGTSAPELIVNIMAAWENHPQIVYGNILGSNIFNILIIGGLAGLITPLVVSSGVVWREIPLSIITLMVLFGLSNNFFLFGPALLSRHDGLILLGLFGLFLYDVFRQLKNNPQPPAPGQVQLHGGKILVFIAGGLAGLALGGRLVVNTAIELAVMMQASEKIIAITIVAAGTSLPELATTLAAVLKKKNNIAMGNIIGSNIFNVLFIMGVSSLIRPLHYQASFNSDFYVLATASLLLFLAMFSGKKKKLDRWEAAVMLLLYLGYTGYLFLR